MAAEPADPALAVPEDPADPVAAVPEDPVDPADGVAEPEAVKARRVAAAVVQDPGSWEAAVRMIDPVL